MKTAGCKGHVIYNPPQAVGLVTAPALVQSADMKGMDMKGMESMDHKPMKSDKAQKKHKAVGVVKKVDLQAGSVTLAHEPVKSMKWPAMTMAFPVEMGVCLSR